MHKLKHFVVLYFENKMSHFHNRSYSRTEAHLHFYDAIKEESLFFYAKRNNDTGEADVSSSVAKSAIFITDNLSDHFVPITAQEAKIFRIDNNTYIYDALLTFDKLKIIEKLNIHSLIPYMI